MKKFIHGDLKYPVTDAKKNIVYAWTSISFVLIA